MSLLPFALDAVRRSFHVHPCEPGGKKPLTKWGTTATNDIATVVRWWQTWPMANIGVACKPSGLLVIDCDIKPGHDGWLEWVDIASAYDPEWFLTPTMFVRTGGGGTHVLFRWPAHVQASQAGLSAHVDIRSNGGQCGGYVLGPGSITAKGSYRIEEDEPIADAPAWLVELCRERPRQKPDRAAFAQPAALNFAGLATGVATATEGNRNQYLLYAARCMCEDSAPLDEALALLVPAATSNGLGQREAEDTIRSAYRLQSMRG